MRSTPPSASHLVILAEDKADRWEACTALLPPAAEAEPVAQREAAAEAEPVSQREAAAAEPVAQRVAEEVAEPVGQRKAVTVAESVARQQAAEEVPARSELRQAEPSVDSAETTTVRL